MKTTKRTIWLLAYCLLCYICISCEEEDDAPANNPPTIEAQSFSVQENSASGTAVGTVKATDQDEDDLTFSITGGNNGEAFAIDAASGAITVKTSSELDFETNTSFTLVVQVSDGKETASANISISVVDESENLAPLLDNQTFNIDENSENGTVVGTIQASDPDEDALTFSITGGNTGDAFAVDAASGKLTVNTSSELDYETTPSFVLTVDVSDGQLSSTAEITVELNDIDEAPTVGIGLLATREEVLESLDLRYAEFSAYLEFAYLFDGVYANTTASPSAAWNNLHAHTHNMLDPQVLELWTGAYDIIFGLNNIILSAEEVLTDIQEKDEVTGQALAMRSYLYFNLVSWFSSVPLELELTNTQSTQTAQPNMLALIVEHLVSSISMLPESWPVGQTRNLDKGFAQALLARIYLFNENWSEALSGADGLIGSALYDLSDNTSNFTTDNSELIWGFDQTGSPEFSGFFSKGGHVPVLRLTEQYLIKAEVNITIGSLTDTKDALDALKVRAGEGAISAGLSPTELLEITLAQWQSEMNEEGITFFTLRRFGKAESELSISNFQLLLPIPLEVLDNNPNFFQNSGY